MGWFAAVTDSEGNALGLYKSADRASPPTGLAARGASATIAPMRLVDSHCHLQADRFDDDVDAVLGAARRRASSGSSSRAGTPARPRRALALAERFPWLDAAVGVHPHDAATVDDAAGRRSRRSAADPRVVAIGETGLDYDRVFSPILAQLANLRRNLALAAETGKPAILHCRSRGRPSATPRTRSSPSSGAFGDDAAAGRDPLVQRPGRLRRGDARARRRDLVLRARVPRGRGGHRRRRPPRPADRLLVETDSPFLSPPGAPRGRNAPEWVRIRRPGSPSCEPTSAPRGDALVAAYDAVLQGPFAAAALRVAGAVDTPSPRLELALAY